MTAREPLPTSVIAGHANGVDFLRRPGASGPRLLLLHGIGSNAASFRPLLESLPAEIDAIAWDAPGYGKSQPLATGKPVPHDYAKAAKALLDALAWPRAIILGHSLGALFATSLAAHAPARVEQLILLSPALGYGVPPGGALPATVQARLDDFNALGPQAFAAKRAARLVGNPDGAPHVLAAVTTAMAALRPTGYAQAVCALGAGDLLADAACVTCAAAVAVGDADVVTPPDNARAAQAALRFASPLTLVPGAGHALPQERPRDIAALIARLVRIDAAA